MPDSNKKNVVLVDDDADMSRAVERLLRVGGFHATTFSSGEALLAAAASVSDTDCLILDVQLPGISGFDAWQQLAKRGRTPPVIFVTAYDDPAARAQAQSAGAVAFLAKPFRGQLLLDAIAEAVSA